MVRAWLRFAYHVGYVLGRLRVSPTAVTVAGVLLCFCVPLLVTRPGNGPFLGALFVLLAAVADSVDGAVAVVTGRTTRLGYVYDSVADRLGEVAWLLAFWLVGAPGCWSSRVARCPGCTSTSEPGRSPPACATSAR